MTETETNLIEGLRKQSPKAQQQMLDRYGHDAFAQVVRLVSQTEDAEEVYQDVFMKVFSHIGQFDGDRSSLRTWVMRIAYNEAISFLRRKGAPTVYYDDYDRGVEMLTDAEVDETLGHASQETVQLIRAALQHLPPEERALVTMFYYEEMSLKEIAYVTESIPTTVASRLCRTRKKLCRIIKMLQA
jgi:RNA polymerase sigma-70 factor (ECF subfamily)